MSWSNLAITTNKTLEMILLKNNLAVRLLALTLVTLTIFGCATEDELLPPPNELTLAEVMTVKLKNQFDVSVDGFVQSVEDYSANTIEVTTADRRTFYYTREENSEIYYLAAEKGDRELINVKSALSEASGIVACSRRFSSGGVNYRMSVECGLFTCYLHTDQVDSNGNVTSEGDPVYLGTTFGLNIPYYCTALALVEL